MNSATRFDTDVLIVGAGPTGLALAITLSRAGIRPIVVDRLQQSQNTSRAAVIHAHTLDVLETLGVSERLVQEGLQLSHFSVRDRDSMLARLDFDWLPSRFACLLMLPQDRTEAILAEALAQARGAVRWGTTVETLRETADGVDVTLASEAGRETLRARYVVGADGMHSAVRERAGIGFAGHAYEQSFVLADVDMDWPLGRDEVMLFFSPEGPVVVAPLPGSRYRIVASLDDAPAQPDAAAIQRVLETRGPASGWIRVKAVHWSSRFRLHHRVADHYRRGRLFLVGDAAHVHSPAGGQGMNTGLVDAVVLGKLLPQVIAGRQPDRWLDHYERLRRPAAQQVLRLAGRLTAAATLKGRVPRALRNLAFRIIGVAAPLRRRVALGFSGIGRQRLAVVPAQPQGLPIGGAFMSTSTWSSNARRLATTKRR
jgi:2-polyprenyl-6-methoxyphenol hydroxylase-like FAD-dependent oxidoreductase